MKALDGLPALARAAVNAELRGKEAPDVWRTEKALQEPGACFVTLTKGGELRGCIGSLQAHRPLGEDVVQNACSAAFRDPRFPSLHMAELPEVRFEVSVLTKPEPFPVADEEELIRCLRPGRDGLILQAGSRRATFLPSVWTSLPSPADFVAQLKRKAGFGPLEWPADMVVERYRAMSVAE